MITGVTTARGTRIELDTRWRCRDARPPRTIRVLAFEQAAGDPIVFAVCESSTGPTNRRTKINVARWDADWVPA